MNAQRVVGFVRRPFLLASFFAPPCALPSPAYPRTFPVATNVGALGTIRAYASTLGETLAKIEQNASAASIVRRPTASGASSPAAPVGSVHTASASARLAVFDYDGTIIDGQSGSLFSRYLLSHGLISVRTGSRLLWWGVRYKLHLPYRQDEARELIFRDLGRRGHDEALRIMRAFHDEVLRPLYRADAAAEVRRRHEEGCVTLLISATFEEIARLAAEELGVDGFAATCMECDASGAFTGKVAGEVVAGPGKCRAVERWADAHLGTGAWVIAYAYGDHFTDEPLLERAETPFAVDPGTTLARIARRRMWQILEWR